MKINVSKIPGFLVSHVIAGSAIALFAWALVLRYGTAKEKAWAMAAIVVSPIPPIP